MGNDTQLQRNFCCIEGKVNLLIFIRGHLFVFPQVCGASNILEDIHHIGMDAMTFDDIREWVEIALNSVEILLLELCGIFHHIDITGILFRQRADNRQCLDKHANRVHQFCTVTTIIDSRYKHAIFSCYAV